MSIADQRRAVTRKAAGCGLVAIASLEIGAIVWSAASIGYRFGILLARDLLDFALMSWAIIAQAVVVWAVVGRDPAANPARRVVLCLIVALAVGLPAFVNLTPHGPKLVDVVLALSLSLAIMSLGILIATGIGLIYFAMASRSPGSRTISRSR